MSLPAWSRRHRAAALVRQPSRVDCMLRFSTAQLCAQLSRLSTERPRGVPLGALGDSSDQPIELSDDDREVIDLITDDEEEPAAPAAQSGAGSSSSNASVESIDVPSSDLRVALRVGESGVVPGQPGVYAIADLPANSLVTVYTYDRVVNEATLQAMGDARRNAVNRYAVQGPEPDVTFILDTPVDRKHVGALFNEPAAGSAANMALNAERVALADGDVYFVLALYTCNAPVSAGEELVWFYGRSYEAVREQERYTAGRACTSKEPLDPPLEEVVQRVVAARGDNVEGILYKLDDDESSDSSDSAYQGRAGPQQRRVQPRRA